MKDEKLYAEKTLGTLSNKMNVFWKEEMCTKIQEALEGCYSRGYYVGRAEGEQAQKQIRRLQGRKSQHRKQRQYVWCC